MERVSKQQYVYAFQNFNLFFNCVLAEDLIFMCYSIMYDAVVNEMAGGDRYSVELVEVCARLL